MTVLGVGIETAATMDSEPVIMVPGEPQTYTTQQKNQVDRFPISLMQSSSTIQLQTRQVQKETRLKIILFWGIFKNSHFWLTFVHSKCKRSSLHLQCWVRLFLQFSNTIVRVWLVSEWNWSLSMTILPPVQQQSTGHSPNSRDGFNPITSSTFNFRGIAKWYKNTIALHTVTNIFPNYTTS